MDVFEEIINLERIALTRWGNGDPSGFLEISAPDVVYFDPYVPGRIDGLPALTAYYKTFWGQVHFDRFELINPQVLDCGGVAVLTFNYVSFANGEAEKWNCTEIYRQDPDGWRIIQSHWSYTEVFKNKIKG